MLTDARFQSVTVTPEPTDPKMLELIHWTLDLLKEAFLSFSHEVAIDFRISMSGEPLLIVAFSAWDGVKQVPILSSEQFDRSRVRPKIMDISGQLIREASDRSSKRFSQLMREFEADLLASSESPSS